jgi:hypothetical protein
MNVSAKRTGTRLVIVLGSWLAYCGVKRRAESAPHERERERFFKQYNDAHARMKAENPEAWKDELREREMWDKASGDGVLNR